jgi:hypothetical protein
MAETYSTPLARWARALEIFIPGYMFGKAYGIADEKTVDLFRAQFPAFLINLAEYLKGILHTDNANLQRFITNTSGALIGFILIAILAMVMHVVLRDRKYVDTLRFTAVTLLPIAVLNGTLSHAVKTLVENMGTQTVEALTNSAIQGPRNYIVLNFCFYMICLWMLGRRTGVVRTRRWGVICVGIAFMAVYLASGLMITASEWQVLLPKLQEALSH